MSCCLNILFLRGVSSTLLVSESLTNHNSMLQRRNHEIHCAEVSFYFVYHSLTLWASQTDGLGPGPCPMFWRMIVYSLRSPTPLCGHFHYSRYLERSCILPNLLLIDFTLLFFITALLLLSSCDVNFQK